ncbi:MAG: GMP synthase (glutamine-hydrolyzing), N-terminal domain or A subunit [Halorubrum sp. J07HR59]|nr:MAG: GMP synthase (glutamine-hydrolyzing), N-terminal domain or A subunit [Halorubrum sp. J07HR59]
MTRILVVDNHGQFTHLEHRALRDMGVETETIDNDTPVATVEQEADGLVLSGGPDIDRIGRCPEYLELDLPVLGICLGMQLIASELDGKVGTGEYGGYADVDVDILSDEDPLVGSLGPQTRVWASHADEVVQLPEGFDQTASSDVCMIEAFANTDRNLYGVQWHPEVAHTEEGEQVFENFLKICEEAADTAEPAAE